LLVYGFYSKHPLSRENYIERMRAVDAVVADIQADAVDAMR
jgi:hypothetical protein